MNKYEFYSKPLSCDVTVTYKDGRLFSFEAPAANFDINESHETKYSNYFTESAFLKAALEHGVKITKTTVEITFDQFYEKYAHKTAKAEAQRAWLKLSKKDQVDAYFYIPAYEAFRKTQQHAKLYPASYLNAKRWQQ